jgi:DNA recombination-dependent growth factor C
MAPFRKNGSFIRFFVEGEVPAFDSDGFLKALAEYRFRTIENAATEDESLGWVSPGDASGSSFLREEIVLPGFARLRMRLDKKKLPSAWVKIYMDAEIRAKGGRKLNAKERKELREDIADQLLPRVLPSVRLVDILYQEDKKRVFLFASSQNLKESLQNLFFKTFGARLIPATALEIAETLSLSREKKNFLERCRPLELGSKKTSTSMPEDSPKDHGQTTEASA